MENLESAGQVRNSEFNPIKEEPKKPNAGIVMYVFFAVVFGVAIGTAFGMFFSNTIKPNPNDILLKFSQTPALAEKPMNLTDWSNMMLNSVLIVCQNNPQLCTAQTPQ